MKRGERIERREIITAIRRGLDPYPRWQGSLESAAIPSLRFVVSNTTEAGIGYVERFRRFGGGSERGLISPL
jgi:tagaturonate reductase